MKLERKVTLITGAARGIGLEIAHAYSLEGANVVICDLQQGDVDEVLLS